MKPRKLIHSWQLYVMVLPAFIYAMLFFYKPMYGLIIAFKDYSFRLGMFGSPWNGFKNFERLFSSYWFPVILKNTFTISMLSLIAGFPVPILLSLIVNEVENLRIKNTVQTVTYAPHFISTVVVCGMITMFLNPGTGIINRLIGLIGIRPVFFMQEASYFKWIYVISGIWQEAGWESIIYTAALSGIDKSLHEAADIDGANKFQKIIYINFPVLIPTIVVLFILRCGSLLSVGYEKVFLLQTDTNLNGSEVISTYVYKVGIEQSDFSFSTATGIFNSVVNSAILIIANMLSKRAGNTSLW